MGIPQLEYMYSLDRFGIKPGLERMQAVMKQLGNPENTFSSIHITGTNGKGSVTAMIESVLRASGKKVGMYTSPHLYTFNERIQVRGVPISDADLITAIDDVKAAAAVANVEPTFFEFTTAVCYLYFSRQHLDIAVIEVGLGGLLDATNVITPVMSVITNIGLDHQEFLGDTKDAIAREKAGIIKPKAGAITGEADADMLAVLDAYAKKQGVTLQRAQDTVTVKLAAESLGGQRVRVSGAWDGEVELPLLGAHQLANLQVALAALAALPDIYKPAFTQVQSGIAGLSWEGRLDIVSANPLVIVDGAHNADGLAALVDFLKTLPRLDVLVLGLKQDKQVDGPLQDVVALFDRVIVTEGNYMPQPADEIAKTLSGNIEVMPDVTKALTVAKDAVEPDGTMVVAGSLYVVADVLTILRGK